MKVKDVMQKDVLSVSPNTTLLNVSNIIFGHGINGVPVVDRGKMVGMITERDILGKFFPSLKDYIEDPVHEGNFEAMEQKAKEILTHPAEDIMNSKFVTVTPETPLLKANSVMEINKIGRLPVVTSEKDMTIVGIVSKGDIFNALVGQNLNFAWGQEEFHDWFASQFDKYVEWKDRLDHEIPFITRAIKNRGTKIIDVGCGTGEHAIALAKLGFEVLGTDQSSNMIKIASGKTEGLPQKVKNKLSFRKIKAEELDKKVSEEFDAAIIMGGVIAHSFDLPAYLEKVHSVLNPEKNTIIIQVPSYAIILEEKRRFNSLEFVKPLAQKMKELAFLTFYDFRDDGFVNLNAVELEKVKDKWAHRGVATTVLAPFTRKKILAELKKLGYRRIEVFRDRSHAVFNPPEEKSGIFIVAKQ